MPRESLENTIERAAMTRFDYNTRVLVSADPEQRIAVSSAVVDPAYGDHMMLQWYRGNGVWEYMHMSPARARILAKHLTEIAAHLEKSGDPGMNQIDTPTQSYERQNTE